MSMRVRNRAWALAAGCLALLAWWMTREPENQVLAQRAVPAATAWPLYRGTAQQLGVAPVKLANRLKPVWKFRTGGPVTSSPVVAGGRVYIGSGDSHVYALRLVDGRKIWSYKTGDAVEAPPSIIGGAVVVGSSDGFLYCLDAATGKQRWKYKTEDKVLGAANGAPAPGGK